MMVVPVGLRPTFTAGTPRMLFEGRYGSYRRYSRLRRVTDGRRFLMVQQKERAPGRAPQYGSILTVQNSIEELKARVPVLEK